MYIGKNGKGLDDVDQEQGPAPTNMKAQAARMAATVVPTTNMVSKPSSSSAPATGAPMARASSAPPTAPPAQPSAVGPTAPPAPTGQVGGMTSSGYAGGPAGQQAGGRTSYAVGAGMPPQEPNWDLLMQQALENATKAHVDPTADKAQASYQSQVDNANLMARMGASGFGTSGASGAMSNNLKADLARQLSQLDNQAATTNAGLDQNAFNMILGYRNDERAEAARQAALDAATTEAGGFLDKNKDGKDDTTGDSKAQYDFSHEVGQKDTQAVQDVPFWAGWTNNPGSYGLPYQMNPQQAAQAESLGWKKQATGLGGSGAAMYQDPSTGLWYKVVQ